MSYVITAHIERRTWYVDGKYLGYKSPFLLDEGQTAKDLTGHFYGDWEGTRYRDGAAIIQADLEREIGYRAMVLKNHPDSPLGEQHCHPIRLDDWGEYRVVTNAVAA